ncbi:MAG: hypothetical protein K2H50_05380 [Paramuribaculum sp.]|nr:hypothetical protein [Paramuribaculum sp.]MDE5836416.1 hypothetical protein [Paramuribaculum sp.]
MDIQDILSQLTAKFGDNFDISKVTDALKGIDLKNLDFSQILSKLHADGLLNNLNLDSVKGGVLDGLKDKAGDILGGIFGK